MNPSDNRGALDAMEAAVPTFMRAGMIVDEQGKLAPDEEHEVRKTLVYQVKPMLEKLQETEHDLFSTVKDRHEGLRVKATRVGVWFLRCLRSETRDIFEMFPSSKFNPYFEAFLSSVNRYGLMLGEFHIRTARGENVPHLVDRLNHCVGEIRQELRSPDFRRRLRDYRRPIKKNYDSLMQYFGRLFARHARLLIIRVDLSYKQQYRQGVTPEVVIRHRQAMLDELNAGTFGPMHGYAARLELGKRKGYHSHWVIFLDGDVKHRDTHIAMQIGQHWDRVVTEGRGCHYNCNARKEVYKNCFLGVAHHTNAAARRGLETYAQYITKPDELFKLAVPGIQSLWKGRVSEPLAGPRAGRPRKPDKGDSQWPS